MRAIGVFPSAERIENGVWKYSAGQWTWMQAHLKGLLSRDQGSPDIVTDDLIESPLPRTSDELLAVVRQNNPQIQVDANSIRKQDAQLASVKREAMPDFTVGYMYQNTDRKYL
jgi:outer membrane protein, heavy metal efflux system